MTRRIVHRAFAAATLLCVAALVIQGLRLRHAIEIDRAIAESTQWAARQTAETPGADARGVETPTIEAPMVDRRIALAHAVALSEAGRTDAALRSFNALTVHGAEDEVARAALFDVGNLYLRQGLRDTGNAAMFLPMLELAKQRYRDVLRADPSDWDARFNLERALRYAPEDKEAFEQPDDRPVERPPNKLPELLAPDLP